MNPKPVVPREQASRDVDDAVAYYVKEHAQQAALDLVDALQDAYSYIGRRPGMGSPHYAHELDIPELRTWPLDRFPYLVFYVDREGQVDVWRVLHTSRDIPALMQGTAE